MSIIANTTVLSNFASIRQLEIVHRLFGRLSISTEVYEEIQTGLEEGYDFYTSIEEACLPFAEQGWIEVVAMTGEAELRLFKATPAKLHRGEASSIAIARERRWLFLSDDKARASTPRIRT